ncbi:leucine-rich repeat flightless-interacting protein 1 isoform X5 [Xenopus laevis]|uniref:Leucine-rich repeat flightless-interacting protein 1 isoform X5 n=1 Tax=Xenopus laevis TaxID=8355 RepID=A0A8J0TVA9_XENLA|nr:leucine-rich repeat flightless-interacting protein 1 isoform X5 [Xenopus laevis]
MGTQGPGRKRHPNRERLSAEDQALNHIAREAEARLAAKRAARAEAREIRMKELERQQKEIYQVQKKYYGLDAKWGDIEQWMEDSERYSYRARRTQQGADDDDVMSVGSRSSLRTNGYEEELLGATQYRKSSRSSTGSGETYQSSRALPRDESTYYSDMSLASAPLTSKPLQAMHNGNRPSLLNCNTLPSRSQRGSLYDDGIASGSRRYSSSSSKPPSEYSCYLGSGSRASSRASSARASPVNSEPPGSTVFRRGSACGSGSTLSHGDDISVPPMFGVEERPEKDFSEKGSRPVSSLSAATLASLGGTSSRRGSGDTSISVDTEASIREIKDSLAEVEEKYKRSMVTNAQLDNEKSSLQYQVDTLRDVLLELEEELAESRRQHEEKNKECERQKHEQNVLRFQLAELKDALEQREQLLTEIRQLQQKQENNDHEICDLKETIEWKDKKIGALERQKEFFDPVRCERDDLREEVSRLREALKKHGIALDSEDTPNGDASIEPHIIEECHMESPQKATALGKADESDVTEQEMSLMSQRSQTEHEQEKENEPLAEQDREEEQEKSPEEFPFQAENNVATDFQRIQELKSENPDELKQDPSADDGCSQNIFGQSLSQQREDCKTVLKHLASEEEGGIEVEVKAIEGKGTTVEHITSVVDGEVAQNQRGGSPGESEVFQDALDFVKQTQNVTECVCETAFSLSSDMKDNFQDQKAENMEEDHDCTVESAEPVSGSEGCEGIVNVREASSCSVASEESADQTSSDSDDFRETGENVEIIGSKVDHEIPKENVFEFTPNESSLNVQIQQETEMEPITTHNTEEALPALESEKKPGDEDNEIIKKDKFEISTHKEETTKTFKENEAEAVEVFPPQSLKLVLENEAVTSVACDSNPSEDGQAQCHFIECTNVKVDREKLEDGLVISDSEKKEQIYSDAGLESSSKSNNESFNLSEGENVIPGEQKGQKEGALDEADKEESMTQNADESECKQAHTELLVTKEEVKNEEKDDLEDENHDEENGSNEEEEDHDEEEDNGPSEKYQGESEIRLGSSVDMTSSMEDVRSEVSTNKSIKLVKGKNKEDCVIS